MGDELKQWTSRQGRKFKITISLVGGRWDWTARTPNGYPIAAGVGAAPQTPEEQQAWVNEVKETVDRAGY